MYTTAQRIEALAIPPRPDGADVLDSVSLRQRSFNRSLAPVGGYSIGDA